MKKNYILTLISTFCFSVLSFGQIFITELADPNDNANARYIELYNSGSSDVDLKDWRIDKYTNASQTVSQTVALTGVIKAGEFYIIATGPEDTVVFDTWGITPDQWDPEVNHVAGSNGDDNLELYNASGTLIDQYGVPGTDGTNEDHEFEDGRAERKPTVTSGNPTWDFNEWNIDNDGGDGDGAINTDGFDPRAWIGTSTSPIVTTTGSVDNLTYFEGKGPSSEDDFAVSGNNLTADLVVSAPSDFEVSLTSGGNFTNSVNVTQTSGNASATIYVRLKAGLSVNTYSGDVTVSSSGATDATISVTGEVEPATPQFNVTAFLDSFSYLLSEGGPSAEDDFSISGDNLTGDIIITAPDNFEVSLTSESSFMNSLIITPTDGSVPFTSVYVRLKTGLSEGNYMGDISIISEGVTEEIISISGNVFGAPSSSMIITGAYDGPLSGGTPKGVELYVLKDIPDLSLFGVSSVTNGQGSTDGNVEFSFPSGSATSGTFIYVASEETGFESFFGMKPTYNTGVMNINGDDAIELYENGQIIDVFGTVDCDPNASGTPCPEWDHLDGWAYRKSNTGPEGTTFTSSNWTYSGANALDGESTNADATTPFPIGTYTNTTASVRNNSIEGFTTYPNPVLGSQFTITSNSTDRKEISIFNVIGKKVLSSTISGVKADVDVSSISSGLYILKVTEGNKTATSKLVIK